MVDFLAVHHRYRLVAPKIVDEAHFGGLFEREHLTRPAPMGPKSALRMRRFIDVLRDSSLDLKRLVGIGENDCFFDLSVEHRAKPIGTKPFLAPIIGFACQPSRFGRGVRSIAGSRAIAIGRDIREFDHMFVLLWTFESDWIKGRSETFQSGLASSQARLPTYPLSGMCSLCILPAGL